MLFSFSGQGRGGIRLAARPPESDQGACQMMLQPALPRRQRLKRCSRAKAAASDAVAPWKAQAPSGESRPRGVGAEEQLGSDHGAGSRMVIVEAEES